MPQPTGKDYFVKVGEVLNYVVYVRNEGMSSFTNINVEDTLVSQQGGRYFAGSNLKGEDGSDNTLSPGEIWTYRYSYTVKDEDVEKGFVNNKFTATSGETTAEDEVTVNKGTPQVTLTKTVAPKTVTTPQEVIYTYTIKNTGAFELTGLSLVDDKLGKIDLTEETLAVEKTMTITKAYNVTWDDLITKEGITNVATLTSNAPEAKAEATLAFGKTDLVVKAKDKSWDYDGKPHSSNETEVVSGNLHVVEGVVDQIEATCSGSITEVGSVENKITSIRIMRGKTDVTDLYRIEQKPGLLTINQVIIPDPELPAQKINLTVQPKDVSKTYDGTPLTPAEVVVTGLPKGYTVETVFSGSQTNAGKSESKVTTIVVRDGSGKNVTEDFNIKLNPGVLKVEKRPITLTSETANKIYDGTALTAGGITVGGEGFAKGEDFGYTFTGSQLNAGSSSNSFTCNNKGATLTDNYNITVVPGTLKVDKRPITMTSNSARKTYDGTVLTAKGITVGGEGMAKDESFHYTYTGARKNAGTSKNTFTVESKGSALLENYEITEKTGNLKVEKRPITLTSESATKTYDGTQLTANGVKVGGEGMAKGEELSYTFTGKQRDAGSSKNYFSFEPKKGVSLGNYEIVKQSGVLTVNKRNVTLTSASASKAYDGTPLTAGEISIGGEGFIKGESATFEVSGSQVEIGESENHFTYKLSAGTSAQNYEIVKQMGLLQVLSTPASYRVEYHFDGKLNPELTETLAGEQGATIYTYPNKIKGGYKVEREENLPLTLVADAAQNVIRVYYVKKPRIVLVIEAQVPLVGSMSGLNTGDCLE